MTIVRAYILNAAAALLISNPSAAIVVGLVSVGLEGAQPDDLLSNVFFVWFYLLIPWLFVAILDTTLRWIYRGWLGMFPRKWRGVALGLASTFSVFLATGFITIWFWLIAGLAATVPYTLIARSNTREASVDQGMAIPRA